MVVVDFGQILINYLALSIGIINVCLMMGLLYSYGQTYREIKSGFTIGLIYFTTLILIQNVFITLFLAVQLIFPPTFVTSISEVHEPIKPLFFINLIQLIALIILFRITRK
jgi:hypothetical protein